MRRVLAAGYEALVLETVYDPNHLWGVGIVGVALSSSITNGGHTSPLDKDAPVPRAPASGPIIQVPHVGGLHHQYERRAA